jgi:hypothetical protein
MPLQDLDQCGSPNAHPDLDTNPTRLPAIAILPNELMLEIFERLDTGSQYSLSLTCIWFSSLVKKTIYKDIRLVKAESIGKSRVEPLLRSVVEKPAIGTQVSSLRLEAAGWETLPRLADTARIFRYQVDLGSGDCPDRVLNEIPRSGVLIDRLTGLKSLQLKFFIGIYYRLHPEYAGNPYHAAPGKHACICYQEQVFYEPVLQLMFGRLSTRSP